MMDHETLLRGSWPAHTDVETRTLSDHLHRGDFESVFRSSFTKSFLGAGETNGPEISSLPVPSFNRLVTNRLEKVLGRPGTPTEQDQKAICAFLLGYAALHAFLQANVTGPPLGWSWGDLILSTWLGSTTSPVTLEERKTQLIRSLIVDGVAPYPLTPHVELLCLAKVIFHHLDSNSWGVVRMRLRTNVVHQKLLSEAAPSLQNAIYEDLERVFKHQREAVEDKVKILVERALIHTYYGLGGRARDDLNLAARVSGFEFILTGRLGKRTKFQQKETSHLVVLARSRSEGDEADQANDAEKAAEANQTKNIAGDSSRTPQNLRLNDDTLLESITFSTDSTRNPAAQDEDGISSTLKALDPNHQPLLEPLDAAILLAYASSISNTQPSQGLTREETLPYAGRVLDGGSSNWQVYTHALLVRSRIEAYRSRTQERGLLQLQALVDQIVAETAGEEVEWKKQSADGVTTNNNNHHHHRTTQTFLPRPSCDEAAPVTERLRYIAQLGSPARWELEAELAARWISVGGVKTALEIYERLQLWAEVALCYAALEKSERAQAVLRRQLYETTADVSSKGDGDVMTWRGERERDPLPADAPRLFCILGDLEQDPGLYERAWQVSNRRYPRAQRSLGRYFFTKAEYARAADAYSKSLQVNRIDHSCWFALGSAKLQLAEWDGAVEAFLRAVKLEDQDAESWSNLAAALMKRGPHLTTAAVKGTRSEDNKADDILKFEEREEEQEEGEDSLRYREEALRAFKRAASLRYDDWRIWENVVIVGAMLSPPAYMDILVAVRRIIEVRGPTKGEMCVDVDVLELLLDHVMTLTTTTTGTTNTIAALDDNTINDESQNQPSSLSSSLSPSSSSSSSSSSSGLQRLTVEVLEKNVKPLITSSRRLWQMMAKMYIWLNRPRSAIDAEEKAWRILLSSSWSTSTSSLSASSLMSSSSSSSSARRATRTTTAAATTSGSRWEDGIDETKWNEVVQGTIDLVDAYERLNRPLISPWSPSSPPSPSQQQQQQQQHHGSGNGINDGGGDDRLGVVDHHDDNDDERWRFKARNAIRTVRGRAKPNWQGSHAWARLEERFHQLKVTTTTT